jgi:hypothetical protein
VRYGVGACPGLPFLRSYRVSFPYSLTPPIPADRHATIKVYSSANAYVKLTVTDAREVARHLAVTISENSTRVALGALRPGTYTLTARAHYRDPGKGSEYACATDSIRVR